ncbi:MAG: hypothetical protein QM751_11170 [Paludibacteraceae bacterium]
MFPRPELGLEKYAGNAFLHFDATKNISMDLSTGTQYSDIISTTQGNHNLPIVGRESSTQYVDFRMKAYGFQLQTNYIGGDQDVQRKTQGFHVQPKVFNESLEYEKAFGSLILRPE